jgi:hypothetical protein
MHSCKHEVVHGQDGTDPVEGYREGSLVLYAFIY